MVTLHTMSHLTPQAVVRNFEDFVAAAQFKVAVLQLNESHNGDCHKVHFGMSVVKTNQ